MNWIIYARWFDPFPFGAIRLVKAGSTCCGTRLARTILSLLDLLRLKNLIKMHTNDQYLSPMIHRPHIYADFNYYPLDIITPSYANVHVWSTCRSERVACQLLVQGAGRWSVVPLSQVTSFRVWRLVRVDRLILAHIARTLG